MSAISSLLLEDVIELDLGHPGPHDVEDERRDLTIRVFELVKRIVDLLRQDEVLDRHHHLDEHVVLGFGLDSDVQLLDAQVDAPDHPIDERHLDVEAGTGLHTVLSR